MLSISPWEILITIVNILVLYAIFRIFLFKPVMGVINKREELIKKSFSDAENDKKTAREMKLSYEEKLNSASQQAHEIVSKAKENAEKTKLTAINEAHVQAEEIKNQAAKDIEDMKKKAGLEAKEHIAELAIMAAEKIIEKGDTYDEGSSK